MGETRTIDSIATDYKSFTVSKAFSARVVTTTGNYMLYVVGKGSKSHTECSGRGLCEMLQGNAHASRATPSRLAPSSRLSPRKVVSVLERSFRQVRFEKGEYQHVHSSKFTCCRRVRQQSWYSP